MADETIAQVDTDIQTLTGQVNTFLTQLTAFLNGLSTPTLTDAQQADLTALKTAVGNLSTALPAQTTTTTSTTTTS